MSNSFRFKLILAFALTCGFSGAAQAQQPMSAEDFANAAVQSDAYEIAAGQTAVTQTHSDRIRAFAQQMIGDHTRSSQFLAMAASASRLPPPSVIVGGDPIDLSRGGPCLLSS
jgi:predicted outer membrane protein